MPGPEDSALRPQVYVELSVEKNPPIAINMLIDSGADVTMIPERIGLALGLEKKGRKKRLWGISGSLGYYESKINIRIGNETLRVPCAWVESDKAPILLGRRGVFKKFKIIFDDANLKTEFVLNKR